MCRLPRIRTNKQWPYRTVPISWQMGKQRTVSEFVEIKKIRYPGYEIWSNHVCEEDLITCWICMRNELWSGCKALHIFGLFSNHVFKINFDSLSHCSKMSFDLLLIVDAIIGTKVERSSFFEQFESGSIFILTLDVRITRK